MSHLGHSIVGDKVYGGKQRKKEKINAEDLSNAIQILDRQALHAKSLSFKHPKTGKQISIETKLPSAEYFVDNNAYPCFGILSYMICMIKRT